MRSAMGLIDGKQVWLKKMRSWVVFLDLFLFLKAVLEYAKEVGIEKNVYSFLSLFKPVWSIVLNQQVHG